MFADPTAAMRCLSQLVGHEQGISSADIARLEGLRPADVAEMLERLAAAGLVSAISGTYRLARAESKIRVGDVRGALASPDEPLRAFPGNAVTLADVLRWEDQAFEAPPVARAG